MNFKKTLLSYCVTSFLFNSLLFANPFLPNFRYDLGDSRQQIKDSLIRQIKASFCLENWQVTDKVHSKFETALLDTSVKDLANWERILLDEEKVSQLEKDCSSENTILNKRLDSFYLDKDGDFSSRQMCKDIMRDQMYGLGFVRITGAQMSLVKPDQNCVGEFTQIFKKLDEKNKKSVKK